MKLKNEVYVVSAPSGTGKTTINRRLVQELPSLQFSISHTTRPMRTGEKNGVHYWFVSKEEFKLLQTQNKMLESAEVFGNWYGTSFEEIERISRQKCNTLLEIDVQGWLQVKSTIPNSAAIFVMPPSMKKLWLRLEKRATDSLEVRWKRFTTAVDELQYGKDYENFVINDHLETAYEQIKHFIVDGIPLNLNKHEGLDHCKKLVHEFKTSEWVLSIKKKVTDPSR